MITRKIKQFITKNYNKEKDAYCWYNTEKKLSEDDISNLKDYFNNSNYNFLLIINGCSELRPQRTWCTFPTFLKGIMDAILYLKMIGMHLFCVVG